MNVVYAKGLFVVNGLTIAPGTVWPADDPIVRANPQGFTADPEESPGFCRTTRDVEQATAAPGERRNIRRGR